MDFKFDSNGGRLVEIKPLIGREGRLLMKFTALKIYAPDE